MLKCGHQFSNRSYKATSTIFRRIIRLTAIVVMCTPFSGAGKVEAASVRAMSVEELVAASALIIEGRVLNITTEVSQDNPRLIYTPISIEVLDVIKGNYEQPTITISFLGGQSGSRHLKVHDMQYPQTGEHGIYFVESPDQRQVHPLTGWSQGHFLLLYDTSGFKRVHTSKLIPVIDIVLSTDPSQKSLSIGAARGLQLQSTATRSTALEASEFKSRLRKLVPKK